MNDETWVGGPRHDYICVRCSEKGLCSPAEPWRDLPARAAKCPACGAKRWMQIVFTTMHVSTDAGKRGIAANEMVGPEFDRQKNKQLTAQHARSRPSPFGPVSLTSMANLGRTVEDSTRGQIKPHQIPLAGGKGTGIPGMRIGQIGGVQQPAAPRQWRQRATAQDRVAIQEAGKS